MTIRTGLAATALIAMAFVDFATPAMAQNICINKPPTSLVDSSTEDSDAMQRIEALGNRCVRSKATGRRVTPDRIQSFLELNPDDADIDYGTPLVTGR